MNTFMPNEISNTTQILIKEEQEFGLKKVNQIRYLFILALSFPIISNTFERADYILPNFTALFLFIAITLLHTYVIYRCKSSFLIGISNYLTIIFDFILIIGISVYYWRIEYPENFAFLLKNPLLFYFLIPVSLASLEFKVRPLVFALSLAILSYLVLLIYGLNIGIPLTNSWKDYITGDGFILNDSTQKPIIFLVVGGSMVYAVFRVRNLLSRSIEIESKRATLARYFSPSVVDELTNNSGESVISNNRKYAVILFSDIRKFTSLSEEMDTEELARFLAEYRSFMLNSIFAHGGTLDKFVGDAVMAVFGVPQSRGNEIEIEKAVLCALDMQNKLKIFNQDRISKNLVPIEIGIGLHAGVVFSGNVESSGQMEYTVLGDAVNVASRLESLTKEYNAKVIISEELESQLKGNIQRKSIGEVTVRGRLKPLGIYSLEI